METVGAKIEFIPTVNAIRWVGRLLDETKHRDVLFNTYEAAAMRTLERLAEKQWPPRPELWGAVKASRRLHGITTLFPECHTY